MDVLYYGIAALCIIAGAFVIFLPGLEARVRWSFGLVLVLLGLYRIVHTQMRARQVRWEEEFESLREGRNRERPTEL